VTDAIPDLEATPAWSGDFRWEEVGMPEEATPKQELNFKLKHVDESLERIAAMEEALRK
jgi:hypothetical protein